MRGVSGPVDESLTRPASSRPAAKPARGRRFLGNEVPLVAALAVLVVVFGVLAPYASRSWAIV